MTCQRRATAGPLGFEGGAGAAGAAAAGDAAGEAAGDPAGDAAGAGLLSTGFGVVVSTGFDVVAAGPDGPQAVRATLSIRAATVMKLGRGRSERCKSGPPLLDWTNTRVQAR